MNALDRYNALGLALDRHQAFDLLPDLLDLVGLDAVEGDDTDQEALGLVGPTFNLIVDLVVFLILVIL